MSNTFVTPWTVGPDSSVHGISHAKILEFVVVSNALPDVAVESLACLTLEEPGVAVAIVDIVTCLATGCIVHIENHIKLTFFTFFNYPIKN